MSNSSNKSGHPSPHSTEQPSAFTRRNALIIAAACLLLLIGLGLMAGTGSTDLRFNPDIFSVRRIVIAPAVCLAGYLLVIVGILYRDRRGEENS
jgi:hypothetical protein